MTRAQAVDAVGMVIDAVSVLLPGHWGAIADAVAITADVYARDIEITELLEAQA